MIPTLLLIAATGFAAEISTGAAAAAPAAEARLLPPAAPLRAKRSLDSASEVALDLAQAVAFIEHGQSYFRAYRTGTHTAEENKAFVKFLEDYERELAAIRQELLALNAWLEKKSGLKD